MKNTITTILGNFDVHMGYRPTADDLILNRFTEVINNFGTMPMSIVTNENPDLDTIKDSGKIKDLAIELLSKKDENTMEKALYEATRVPGGSGVRLELSLKKREICLSNF